MKKLVKIEDRKDFYNVKFLIAEDMETYELNDDVYLERNIPKWKINEYNTLEEEIALIEDGLKPEDIEIVK